MDFKSQSWSEVQKGFSYANAAQSRTKDTGSRNPQQENTSDYTLNDSKERITPRKCPNKPRLKEQVNTYDWLSPTDIKEILDNIKKSLAKLIVS